MPRYSRRDQFGYDLALELPFCEVDGVRVLAAAKRIVLVCKHCLRERTRDPAHPPELEFECCDGHMNLMTLQLFESLQPTMRARGIKLTSVEYRRSKRLEREAAGLNPWRFGTSSEADYPEGFFVNSIEAATP